METVFLDGSCYKCRLNRDFRGICGVRLVPIKSDYVKTQVRILIVIEELSNFNILPLSREEHIELSIGFHQFPNSSSSLIWIHSLYSLFGSYKA